jgi:hypothetical protein
MIPLVKWGIIWWLMNFEKSILMKKSHFKQIVGFLKKWGTIPFLHYFCCVSIFSSQVCVFTNNINFVVEQGEVMY